ncbi:MAG: hypothetical protein HQM10_01440 [Candidatus Riflebacteria bacterium]|nr:hypothetical protein [Candidatus Riflebacteria bacterium]
MKLKYKPVNKSGMTMTEVMVGVIIMALVLIPSLNVIVRQTTSVTATRDHLMATFVGQKVIETARSFKYEYLDIERFPATSTERVKTFEHIMNNDSSKKIVKLNEIEYKIVDLKVAGVRNKNDLSQIPCLSLLSFGIEYKSKEGRNNRLDLSTAIAQQE